MNWYFLWQNLSNLCQRMTIWKDEFCECTKTVQQFIVLTNTSAVKVVRKLPYNSKHGRKIEKEDLFSRELAQGVESSGQVARYSLSVLSLLPEWECALYSQGRLSPSLALAARGMACLTWRMWWTCRGRFYSLGCSCDGVLTDCRIWTDPAITGILSNTV